jgi:hypothetical protein
MNAKQTADSRSSIFLCSISADLKNGGMEKDTVLKDIRSGDRTKIVIGKVTWRKEGMKIGILFIVLTSFYRREQMPPRCGNLAYFLRSST